ncbi:MAG: hypothetical protein MJ193_02590, partial [Clostridia bacterium]|nr:hypothetical protein [Clostridia bacterium]
QTTAPKRVGNEFFTETHTWVALYLVGGEFEEIGVGEEVAPEDRFDHYFENVAGEYYFNTTTNKYELLSDLTEMEQKAYTGKRYSYDATYCYQNEIGNYKRINGGLYVDLSYFSMPSIFFSMRGIMNLLSTIAPDLFASEEGGSSEAIAANEGVAVAAADLPLLTDDIALYITAFVWGLRVTSTYIQAVVNADYINQLLALLLGEDSGLKIEYNFTKQPYVQINTDRRAYYYKEYVDADENERKVSSFRFGKKEDDEHGTYYATTEDGDTVYYLRSDLTAEQEAQYVADGGKFYSLTTLDTYIKVTMSGKDYYQQLSTATRYEKQSAEVAGNDYVYYQKTPTLAGNYAEVAKGQYEKIDPANRDAYDEFFEFAALNADELLVALEQKGIRKPLVSVQLYLWEYELGINIGFPEFGSSAYEYQTVAEYEADGGSAPASGKYIKVYDYLYTYIGDEDARDNWLVGTDEGTATATINGESKTVKVYGDYLNNSRYFYYRGNYYAISMDTLYVSDNGAYVNAFEKFGIDDANKMLDFADGKAMGGTQDFDFFVGIYIDTLGFTYYAKLTHNYLFDNAVRGTYYVKNTDANCAKYGVDKASLDDNNTYVRVIRANTIDVNYYNFIAIEKVDDIVDANAYVWDYNTNAFVKYSEYSGADKANLPRYTEDEITYYVYDSWTRQYVTF